MAENSPPSAPNRALSGEFLCVVQWMTHTAGSKAAHQCADAVLHLDAGEAQTESGLYILQPVVNENTFPGLELVFVQQGLIDARVRFVDVHLAGGHAAVEQALRSRSVRKSSTSSGILLR